MITFEAWPKIPRLSRKTTSITEKIDGTNGAVVIQSLGVTPSSMVSPDTHGKLVTVKGNTFQVGAQSRKRLITPDDDNFGFARWVWDNADELVDLLGQGRHFGEWWGRGIQRGYNMDRKVFSLFNWYRFSQIAEQREDWRSRAKNISMTTVPCLYVGKFSDQAVDLVVNTLRVNGSIAPLEWGITFPRPEGVVIYNSDLDGSFKAFVENDDIPKGLQVTNVKE